MESRKGYTEVYYVIGRGRLESVGIEDCVLAIRLPSAFLVYHELDGG